MLNTKESLSEKFVKKWARLYLFSFIVWPIGYIVKIILSHDLRVEEIWILYWIISLISLLTTYHDLWLTESLNYFLPKFIVENDYNKLKSSVIYVLFAQIPTSLFIWSLLFFGADYLSVHYFNSKDLALETAYVLKVFSLFFIWMNLFTIVNTIYWASQNTKYQKGTEVVRMIAILCFTVFFWYFWLWTLANYSWTWIYGLLFWIIFSYVLFYYKYYLPYLKDAVYFFDKELAKQIFWYAFWVLLAANIWTVLWQIDMQLILYFLWPKDAWYYTNYLSIIWIPFLVITPIFWFLYPVISELNSKKEINKMKLIKTMFYKYFSVLAIIVSWFAFVYAKEISVVLYWTKFEMSWLILQYSIFFIIFNFLLQINFQVLWWVWKIKERVKILWVWLMFNLLLNIILIKHYWVVWSSLAVWLSWFPIFYFSHKATEMYADKFDYKFFLKNLFYVSIISWALYYLNIHFNLLKMFSDARLKMLFYILLIWFFYIIVMWLLNFKEFRMFMGEIKKIKTRKI